MLGYIFRCVFCDYVEHYKEMLTAVIRGWKFYSFKTSDFDKHKYVKSFCANCDKKDPAEFCNMVMELEIKKREDDISRSKNYAAKIELEIKKIMDDSNG